MLSIADSLLPPRLRLGWRQRSEAGLLVFPAKFVTLVENLTPEMLESRRIN
jgi:hypothetical protein